MEREYYYNPTEINCDKLITTINYFRQDNEQNNVPLTELEINNFYSRNLPFTLYIGEEIVSIEESEDDDSLSYCNLDTNIVYDEILNISTMLVEECNIIGSLLGFVVIPYAGEITIVDGLVVRLPKILLRIQNGYLRQY